jgi:tetratricopeptide (TPR) repeat protein
MPARRNTWSPGWWVLCVAAVAAGWFAGDDVGFRDSGELGAAGFTLGVAHPTGFALDLLLLRAASLVPLGHAAFRHNALTALEAALCLALLAQSAVLLAERAGARTAPARIAAALLPAAALSGWATFVQSALATEVYALALCITALAAYGCLLGGRARAIGLCAIGLAPGMHVTAGVYAALLVAASCFGRELRSGARFVAVRVPALLACLLVTAYLPLASRRQPAIDWGDPETFAGVLGHLSAARIRSAYHADMLSAGESTSYRIVAQWLELWPLLALALLALALGWRRDRAGLLGAAALIAADLAYAAWINPMGAGDRQVGHVAGAALAVLAGVGGGLLCARVAARWQWPALAAVVALATVMMLRVPRQALGDGYAASELVGSGGPLSRLPPRSILVCNDDDGCAGALFAVHVEAVRPDVSVVPAQHLWDPVVRRQLYATSLQRAAAVPEHERRPAAARAVRQLASGAEPRPVLFTDAEPWTRAAIAGKPQASPWPPFVQGASNALAPAALIAALDLTLAARSGGPEGWTAWPVNGRARSAWSHAYSTLGKALLPADARAARRALERSAQLAPGRAVAWINLGVALEAAGDLAGAERSVRRALALDPLRPTAWVNLARLRLALGGAPAARTALDLARNAGVRDPRLDALAARLR